jgi:hypothetical protein
MSEVIKEFDVFYANIKFGLVPLSDEMQDHLRELEDRIARAEIELKKNITGVKVLILDSQKVMTKAKKKALTKVMLNIKQK